MRELRRIVAPTQKTLFEQEIIRQILAGEMAVGERLPSEREIAEQTGLSKTNIHSGIKEMEQMGFLRVQSKSGIFVEDYMTHGNLNTLVALVRGSSGPLSRDLIHSLCDLFLMVEEFALLRIAEHPSEKEMRELNIRIDQVGTYFASHPADSTGKAREIASFYMDLATLCGSPALPFLCNAMYESVISVWERCVKVAPDSAMIDVMNHVTDRIQAADGPGAVAALRSGTERFLSRI